MAARSVDATVYQSGRAIATLQRRPVRLTSAGYAGVVYQGAVYPLYAGDTIRLEDQPVDKESCPGFVTGRGGIPYAVVADPATEASSVCRIDAWHLESNRFGHYLVFDSSYESAQLLVEIAESASLGVRRWGESTRPADDGEFYDWFIRFAFDGDRAECLQRVNTLFVAGAVEEIPPHHDELADELGGVDRDVELLADLAIALNGGEIDREDVIDYLEMFDYDAGFYDGYLAWRFHEIATRPGRTADASVIGKLQVMRSIVRDDKELVARFGSQYGRFLEDRPYIARRAMDAELDKVDLDAGWRSPDDALRRARASLAFLRHAVILTFGSEDYRERLHPLLELLMPPPEDACGDMPGNVVAAIGNLRRVIRLVEELFSREVDDRVTLYADGRAELLALEDGDFDFLADLPAGLDVSPTLTSGDLPFTVLPPGELVQSFLDELRRSGGYLGRTVDPRRTQVLQDLANHFRTRRCTLHRGAFSSTDNDNGYVVLRLPVPGGSGEDAVAISPLKGEHATYVVRHGCGEKQPWPMVLRQTKREARKLGAKRLLFQVKLDHRIDEYQAMLSKIVALLESDPELFDRGELYFDYRRGRYEMREQFDYNDGGEDIAGRAAPAQPDNVFRRIVSWFGS